MSISGINANNIQSNKIQSKSIGFGNEVNETNEANTESKLEKTPTQDELVVSQSEAKKIKAEHKQIVYKAQTNAAGWSIIGGIISTIYYGVRPDETIAEKYNLDVDKDEKFIKDIRKQQVIATLPGVIFGVGILSWACYKLFGKPKQ